MNDNVKIVASVGLVLVVFIAIIGTIKTVNGIADALELNRLETNRDQAAIRARGMQEHYLCVAALAGRPPVEQVRLLAAFPECAPALADTTVTPRRGR